MTYMHINACLDCFKQGPRSHWARGGGSPTFFRDRSKNFYKYGVFKFTHFNVSMTAKKITRKQIYMSAVVTLGRRNQGP